MSTDDRIAVLLDRETKRQIRIEAAKRDTNMSDLSREVLEEWIEEQDIEFDVQAEN